jgi:co-chaperonin GroES (HSP10)
MEAVDPHFERLKPLFDQVSVCIITPTAESYSSKGSLIAEAIDEKHGLREVVFLGESMQKRSSWISAVRSEQIDTQNQLGVEVYCSIQSRPLAINFDTVSSTATRFGWASGGSGTLSATRCTH